MTAPALTIVTGGQTGVDRAALDVALELGVPCGGWCPAGRLAEDGPIPMRYPLRETPLPSYPQRTAWNVRDSDGTLILTNGPLEGGTLLTAQISDDLGRPFLVVDLRELPRPERIAGWLAAHRIGVLNVAGPRASKEANVYEQARSLLALVLITSAQRVAAPAPVGPSSPSLGWR